MKNLKKFYIIIVFFTIAILLTQFIEESKNRFGTLSDDTIKILNSTEEFNKYINTRYNIDLNVIHMKVDDDKVNLPVVSYLAEFNDIKNSKFVGVEQIQKTNPLSYDYEDDLYKFYSYKMPLSLIEAQRLTNKYSSVVNAYFQGESVEIYVFPEMTTYDMNTYFPNSKFEGRMTFFVALEGEEITEEEFINKYKDFLEFVEINRKSEITGTAPVQVVVYYIDDINAIKRNEDLRWMIAPNYGYDLDDIGFEKFDINYFFILNNFE